MLSRDRPPAARHLHQVHPLPGHHRLHGRHRASSSSSSQIKDLFGLDAEASSRRLPAEGHGYRRARWHRPILPPSPSLRVARRHPRLRLLRPTWPAFLIARRPRRGGGVRSSASTSRPSARRFGGVPQTPADARRCRRSTSASHRGSAGCADDRAPRPASNRLLSAVVADGDDRPSPPLQLRARRAGHRQLRLGAVRRPARHRRHRAHGDQRPRRRHGPVAGILHAVFLLVFMAGRGAARLLHPARRPRRDPLLVAWNDGRARHDPSRSCGASPGEAAVLLATFLLTVLVDLTVAHPAGVVLGCLPVHAPHGAPRRRRDRHADPR